MLRNWFVTALRNFARHRLYSFINIAGLAVGLACAIFIALFLRDELSYDKWIPDTQNLYLVHSTIVLPGGGTFGGASTPFPVTVAMAAHIPEVAAQTHLIQEKMTAEAGHRQFPESIDVVDPDFFQIIKLPLVEGNSATVFAQPDSAVLSQEEARKYFGDKEPVGKTITVDGIHPLTVTGVMRDLPHNTQLVADIAIPNTSKADHLTQSAKEGWLNLPGEAFVRLVPGASPASVMSRLVRILNKNIDVKKEMNVELPGSKVLKIGLTRFTDGHLSAADEGGMTPAGSWAVIYGFGAIAVLILLIACFNFTNLATARAMMRAREIGLRKVSGAMRWQLMLQFLSESIFTSLLALALALALVEVLMPVYDGLLNRPIAFDYASGWPLLLELIGVSVLAGIVGGIYPALVLSGFRPASTLRSDTGAHAGSGTLRSSLVILQFAISIALGIAALGMFAQFRYAQHVDLGFKRDRMVIVSDADKMTPAARESFMHTLAASPAIEGVTQSIPVPFVNQAGFDTFTVPGGTHKFSLREIDAAPNFPKLYGMRLLAGRELSLAHGDDVSTGTRQDYQNGRNILITEAAARRFGWTAHDAVGRSIVHPPATRLTVVGVVADLMLDGVRHSAPPIILFYNPDEINAFSVRVKGGHIEEAVSAIDATWRRFAPTIAIRRGFLDGMFEHLFAADEQQGDMLGIFVAIAIFIACLGLFGLAAFSVERRTREIGVRKVFGAKTRDVVRLLLWQFSIPVLIANAIAWPVAWYWLHNWLKGYAYRISLSPVYFIAAGAAALLIAWLTVVGHSLAVARANPVHALRFE